jgi:UDP-glucose 4-epimerase
MSVVAWVTGARGFIGRHVALEAASRGQIVHGIGHGEWKQTDLTGWGVRSWTSADVTMESLDRLMITGAPPDIVYHLAGGASVAASIADPFRDFNRTVGSTSQLLEWLRTRAPHVRLVFASSAAVYGDSAVSPISPGNAVQPVSPYGHTKAIGESLINSYSMTFGLSAVVVRLFSVYGPGLRKQILWDISRRLAQKCDVIELGGTGEETRDMIHVRDAACMMVSAAQHAGVPPVVFNIGTGVGSSVRAIAESVIHVWPSGAGLTFSGQSRPGDPKHLVADLGMGELMPPRPFIGIDDGIAGFVDALERDD